MAYRALYRTWRPARFAEVSGQAHILKVLTGQIENERIAHAYLFSGPRGTGKTSLAKIFARAVNCAAREGAEPCETCDVCRETASEGSIDIVEIDAASNNGVDSVRELRDRVNLMPATCRYKVYIIDEVHMLSKGAFNALLKTLEEPPAHVIFILATTEPHKLPPTILSRCQRFDFRRITTQEIAARLTEVSTAEGCTFEKGALETIARAAEGGMRDALSLLEQCAASGAVTAQSVDAALGSGDSRQHIELIARITAYDEKGALELLAGLLASGADAHALIKALADVFRSMMWLSVGAKAGSDDEALLEYAKSFGKNNCLRALGILIQKEYEMRQNLRADIVLETAVMDIMCPEDDPTASGSQRIDKLETRLAALEKGRASAPLAAAAEAPAKPAPAEKPRKAPQSKKAVLQPGTDAGALWSKLLESLKKDAYHICPYAAKAQAVLLPSGALELQYSCENEMAAEYIKQPAVLDVVKKALEETEGASVQISVVIEEKAVINAANTDILAMFGANIEEI